MVLRTLCDDPDAEAHRAVEADGSNVFEVATRGYGMRDGRIADPFGHPVMLPWRATAT